MTLRSHWWASPWAVCFEPSDTAARGQDSPNIRPDESINDSISQWWVHHVHYTHLPSRAQASLWIQVVHTFVSMGWTVTLLPTTYRPQVFSTWYIAIQRLYSCTKWITIPYLVIMVASYMASFLLSQTHVMSNEHRQMCRNRSLSSKTPSMYTSFVFAARLFRAMLTRPPASRLEGGCPFPKRNGFAIYFAVAGSTSTLHPANCIAHDAGNSSISRAFTTKDNFPYITTKSISVEAARSMSTIERHRDSALCR